MAVIDNDVIVGALLVVRLVLVDIHSKSYIPGEIPAQIWNVVLGDNHQGRKMAVLALHQHLMRFQLKFCEEKLDTMSGRR